MEDEPLAVRIPADVEAPDKVVYGLTGRQLAVLAATALVAGWVYLVTAPWLPLPVIAAALLPIVAVGAVVAVGRRDGLTLDRFLLAALTHLRAPKALITTPGTDDGDTAEVVAPPPAWCRMRGQLPAPLRLPVRAVREDGVMELADGTAAALVEAGTVAFGLRTAAEQASLVGVFGRWLNSLDGPAQILIQTRPLDLTGLADTIADAATALPDAALAQAASDHAAFLDDLGTDRDLLTRRVLLVLCDRQPDPTATARTGARSWVGHRGRRKARDAGAVVVMRRAEETVRALTGLGVSARVLDAAACTTALDESLSPADPHLLIGAQRADPGDIITSPAHPSEVTTEVHQ